MKRIVTEIPVETASQQSSKKKSVKLAVSDGASYVDPGFSHDVITWQKKHGRHTLPWQNTRDAYRVWLSEIMLQQTQVAAVIPYYQRFLDTFPTVQSLAAAPSEQVMAHWSGLGYYSRARNLHKCAQTIVAQYDGIFPGDPALLEQLPGIGRSTAAAIAAFSYGTKAAILDGNVKRVFARVFGIDRYPGEKTVENELWLRAVALLPEQDVETYTQGLMDLGATLCTRNRPSCNRCPLAQRCNAYATGRTNVLPIRKPKKAVPEKQTAMLVIVDDDRVLLEQRPDSGIWGSLLSLPEIDVVGEGDEADFNAALQHSVSRFGAVASVAGLPPLTHGFTHFKLHIAPYQVQLAHRLDLVSESGHVWYPIASLGNAPLPAPVKKLLLGMFREPDLLSGAYSPA